MAKKLTQPLVMQALDLAYNKALSGIPGMDSAEELAGRYLKQDGTLSEKVNSLIRWQNAKAGSSGFITGLGGFATLPLALPANLVSVLYFQVRMIAAIANMGGYDIRDDRVKSLVYVCLAGNVAKDILQEIGINVGTRLTAQLIGNISEKTIISLNQKIGFQLISKTGGLGAINLSKAIPLAGGIIGGSIDILATNLIGNIARKTFIQEG
ncbi:MAG: EcsC family protein [Lentimicrobium sp.]|nr:EcsC family protein [Lentimicrobium sp.]